MVQPIVIGEHRWVVSALIDITPQEADTAVKRRTFKTAEARKVEALETYCRTCRRTYQSAVGTVCELDQQHRGGPKDTRKRRQPEDDARTVSGSAR